MADENAKRGASEIEESERRESRKLDVSGAQVAGGALASVTAAFLGSHLGVAGTVFGAGLTSVIITLGGALYQRSLEKTKKKLEVSKDKASDAREALKRATRVGFPRPLRDDQPGTGQPGTGRTAGNADLAGGADPAEAATRKLEHPGMHWPGGESVVDDPNATRRISVGDEDETAVAQDATQQVPGTPDRTEVVSPPAPRRGIRWGVVAATSALAFVLGMLLITSFEGLTGRPLSGGNGTTVGRVFKPAPRPAPPEPAPQESETREPEPTQAPSRPKPSPSVEPSRQPSTESNLPGPLPPEPSGGVTGTQPMPTGSQPSETAPTTGPQTSPTGSGTGLLGAPEEGAR